MCIAYLGRLGTLTLAKSYSLEGEGFLGHDEHVYFLCVFVCVFVPRTVFEYFFNILIKNMLK